MLVLLLARQVVAGSLQIEDIGERFNLRSKVAIKVEELKREAGHEHTGA